MKIIYLISRASGYAATPFLVLMMLLTVIDVFLRFVFNSPITGTTEITEFMMVVIIFPALAWCALTRRHVRVDLIVSLFPRRVQLVIDTITLLVSLFIFILIAWQNFLESMYVRTTTALLSIPHYPFYWVLTFGFILFCFSIIVLIIENFKKEAKE